MSWFPLCFGIGLYWQLVRRCQYVKGVPGGWSSRGASLTAAGRNGIA